MKLGAQITIYVWEEEYFANLIGGIPWSFSR